MEFIPDNTDTDFAKKFIFIPHKEIQNFAIVILAIHPGERYFSTPKVLNYFDKNLNYRIFDTNYTL